MPKRKDKFPTLTEAEIARAREIMESIPMDVRIKQSRKLHVNACLKHRHWLKHGAPNSEVSPEDIRLFLRHAQKVLLKLRIWRATGQYPSSDN